MADAALCVARKIVEVYIHTYVLYSYRGMSLNWGEFMLRKTVEKISKDFIAEAVASPNLLADMAAMEKYMAESYSGRVFVELLQNADDCKSTKI